MPAVIVHLTVIAIDTEAAAVTEEAEAEEDTTAEMTIERDLVCAHEAEVQKDTKTELIDTALVAAEIDRETVWAAAAAAEEIDISLPCSVIIYTFPPPCFFLFFFPIKILSLSRTLFLDWH